jgi:hypothetical protein
MAVPTIDVTVTPTFGTALLNPNPAAIKHAIPVTDVQLDVRHVVPPISAVMVLSKCAKFRPEIEIGAPPEVGLFGANALVATGESNCNIFPAVPTRDAMVTVDEATVRMS